MKRLSLALLMFAALTPGVAAAAPVDAGHILLSASNQWEDLPQLKDVDLSYILVEDGIHMGPLHEVWADYSDCGCLGLFGDGPFWGCSCAPSPSRG